MTNELAIRILTGDVLGTSEQTHEAIKMAVKALSLPSAQQKGDMENPLKEEAVEYIKNTREYLTDIGETWYADYLSEAIDLLVCERGDR